MVLTKTLQPEVSAVREARRFLERALTEAGVSDDKIDDAVLLTSEVVTNAVVHAATTAELRVSVDSSSVRVEVADGSARPAERRVFDFLSASGRGLSIVATVAADWGVETIPGDGKYVWFVIPA